MLAAAVAAALASAVATAGPASAHPLGNFTVNRYARVEISAGVARVYYVLDEAEIPAFQEGHAVDADPVAFGRARADDINRHLSLAVDGAAVPLTVERTDLSRPPGQGGLRTLRLAVLYTATVAPGATAHAATFADGNEPDRIGWREIVVTARGDGAVRGSTAPAQDLSDELRKYPANAVQAPLDLRRATFTFTPGTIAVAALPIARTAAAPSRAGGRFAGLVARRGVTPGVLAGMLGLALLFGAAHALAPGHGKTVMAAYMVGSEGRPVDAVFLGGAVSLMHTASAIVLGLVLFAVSRSVPVDRVYPALTLVSGVAVVVVGAVLLRSRLRVARRAGGGRAGGAGHGHVHADDPDGASSHAGEHSHDGAHTPEPGHPHGHGHAHGHGHSHVHAPIDEPVAPMSRGGLMVLAGSGGIVPSPSAVIVLVSAFSLGRPGLGLALVAAFSVGLAATLTGVGIALVAGRSMARRRGYLRSLRLMPPAGAAVLVVLGLALAAQGIRGMG